MAALVVVFLIWWFACRKKNKSMSSASGDSGTPSSTQFLTDDRLPMMAMKLNDDIEDHADGENRADRVDTAATK